MRLILDHDIHNPPGHRPISDDDIHRDEPEKPSEPSEEHRDRLARAVRDLDQWRARRGEHGASWTSRKTGKFHTVGDIVSVDGHRGRIVRKHPASGLPEIEYF
jgi:hypothetical protein